MDNQPQKQEPTKKVIAVDQARCIGCGLCVTTCGDVFELGEDGKSHVKNAVGCQTCNCQQALDECPANAISWQEIENPKFEA